MGIFTELVQSRAEHHRHRYEGVWCLLGIHPVPLVTYHIIGTPAEAPSLLRPVLPAQVIFLSLQMLFYFPQ